MVALIAFFSSRRACFEPGTSASASTTRSLLIPLPPDHSIRALIRSRGLQSKENTVLLEGPGAHHGASPTNVEPSNFVPGEHGAHMASPDDAKYASNGISSNPAARTTMLPLEADDLEELEDVAIDSRRVRSTTLSAC
mmetsp:Transcript_27965/g.80814  ORF Transcript_27965/g.80814 Transcript_27965/m.80814 type:complete len:138 (-) Transcript_27965:682-1095(-)